MTKKTITPAVLLAALIASPAVVRADAPPAPIAVEVEITDGAAKNPTHVVVTLTLVDEGTCAEASSDNGSLDYHLKVCRDRGDVLGFDVRRTERAKGVHVTRHVRASARLAAGKRAVIGKLAAGSDSIEIAATAR